MSNLIGKVLCGDIDDYMVTAVLPDGRISAVGVGVSIRDHGGGYKAVEVFLTDCGRDSSILEMKEIGGDGYSVVPFDLWVRYVTESLAENGEIETGDKVRTVYGADLVSLFFTEK